MGLSAKRLGQISTDCPVIDCVDTCLPCDHINYVYDNSLEFSGRATLLSAVTNSVLKVHQDYINSICDYTPELCRLGELLSFPCLQCGLIPIDTIVCCEEITVPCEFQSPCNEFVKLAYSTCNLDFVDLSLAPYTDTYALMLEALMMTTGFASAETIEALIQTFLPDAKVIGYNNGRYQVSLGSPSDDILAILPIIASIIPVPVGAGVDFYRENC